MRIKPATVEIDGKDWEMHFATITSTRLGKEDHGIFTWLLDLDYGGSGQGAGTYALGDPLYFGRHIQGLCNFFGCGWEQIPGKNVFALKENYSDFVRGFVDEKQTKHVIFTDWNPVEQD